MKSRRKSRLQEKTLSKRIDSDIVRNYSESRIKKKPVTKLVLNRSAQYIDSYQNIPREPLNHLGDADTYFKQTLRKYKDSDNCDKSQPDCTFAKKAYSSISLELLRSGEKKNYNLARRSSTSTQLQTSTEPLKLKKADRSRRLRNLRTMADEEEATEPETTEGEDDEMKEVDKMIEQASQELEQVAEENQQLMDSMEKEGEEAAEEKSGKIEGQIDMKIDAAVLKELEDAELQAKETANIIFELKTRVGELLKQDKMTEEEARELEQKNKELKAQMILFEEKTKRIQELIGQTNILDGIPSRTPQKKHTEDVLPKVILCGLGESHMPKIIVCDGPKPGKPPPTCVPECSAVRQMAAGVPHIAKRLSESYSMQEKLAAENADLEGIRYKLQEDLVNKDQTLEHLQRKLGSLQSEMRLVHKENAMLNEKIKDIQKQDQSAQFRTPQSYMTVQPPKPVCPATIAAAARLQEFTETTLQLEKQLVEMETDVKCMQCEIAAVQKERENLEQHRISMCPPAPPCMQPPCMAPCIVPCGSPPPYGMKPICVSPCSGGRAGVAEQQLRELREQYDRLQDDFKAKLTEVAGLRADNEKLKLLSKEAEEYKKTAEEKVKECDKLMKSLKTENNKFLGSKEQLVEQEQQLNVAKQRFREAQDELEELRAFVQDQTQQLDDYRNKYLEAQQQVEEHKRQIDMMDLENNRVNEQVNLEIQRVKNQFQEKLQELTPLPDILKATQLKLQDAQQMHMLAERNNEALTRELQMYRDKATAIANEMEQVRSDQQLGADEKATLTAQIEELDRKCNELMEEGATLQSELSRTEDLAEKYEKQSEEQLHEIAQLMAQLEGVREESARQVARTKDRCETVRRSMQNQISDLERQLAQSRAQARSAQKDRDDIRQKMQAQINNLNENFEDAQIRIKNLQGHVNYLKHSYPSVFSPEQSMITDEGDVCNC